MPVAYPQMPEPALERACATYGVTFYPQHGSSIYEQVNTAAAP